MNTTYFLKMASGTLFGKVATPVIPSTYYVGVSTTTPNTDGTGVTEPSGGSYARVAISNDGTSFNVPDSNGLVTNKQDLVFPESTTNWGIVTNYVIYDSLTNGNLLMYGALTSSRSVEAITTLIIKAGQLQLQATNPA